MISKLATAEYITTKNYGYRPPSDIKFIIPHHLVAHWTGTQAAKYFVNNGCENSVNYCIGYGGDIVCNVYEENGAWTSSFGIVDRHALTIECSDTSPTNFKIPEPTQEALIMLMVDFFQRYPSLGGKAIFDPSDATEVVLARREGRVPNTKGNILLHKWTSGFTTTCPEWHMIEILPSICEEVNKRLAESKRTKYMSALEELGDGRYHYYDGRPNGIGCSEYTRQALVKAGVIKEGETFHAGNGEVGVLADTTRFQRIPWSPSNLQWGDIMWSNGHHVATWDGNNGVYEAAPENSHGVCDNGKTGVGHFSKHTYYNCGTGNYTWTCIYRIIETSRTLREVAQYMITYSINEPKRSEQAKADGFDPTTVQAEIDRMLGKDKTLNVAALVSVMPTIKNGSKVPAVYALQAVLKAMGYYTGEIDGSFGTMTETALSQYQWNINKVYGNFDIDGICRQQTWKKLLGG